jgi:uridine kinase
MPPPIQSSAPSPLPAPPSPRASLAGNPAVCYLRRLRRDVAERGRTPESVRDQYQRTVRPSAERFVIPTRAYANLIVSGEEPLDASTNTVIRALSALA